LLPQHSFLVAPFVAFLAFGSSALASDPNASAAEGHRLFQAGQFAKAAAKLEAAVGSSTDPEVLFELAVCYERLDRDSEAIAEFQAYGRSPVALRIREANEHVATIQSKRPGPAAPRESLTKPRRVLVPTTGDSEKCVKDCGKPASPFCGNSSNRMQKACAIQFSCLRGCPGARVEPGSCPIAPRSSVQVCLTDR
jgi:Tetratricopeptide repeat